MRAGKTVVDFKRHKVGSLRDQLERCGVDADPLVRLVHQLAREWKRVGGGGGGGGGSGSAPTSPPMTPSKLAFQATLAREKLSGELERWIRDGGGNGGEGARSGSGSGSGSGSVRVGKTTAASFVDAMPLTRFRAALETHSLLARGLDECVEALVDAEWEGGDDGFVDRKGERAEGLGTLPVSAFKARLARHGLEGSLEELRLCADALCAALRPANEREGALLRRRTSGVAVAPVKDTIESAFE